MNGKESYKSMGIPKVYILVASWDQLGWQSQLTLRAKLFIKSITITALPLGDTFSKQELLRECVSFGRMKERVLGLDLFLVY